MRCKSCTAAVLAAAAMLAGCGSSDMTSHGSITVEEGCTKAASDYPDIDTGTQVTITDSSGNVISTGSLGYSHGARLGFTSGPGSFGGECVYPFSVQVPGG